MFGRKERPAPDDVAITGDELDPEERSALPDWLNRWMRRFGIYLIIVVLLIAFIALAVSHRVFYRIETGQRGVRWSLFGGGTVLDRDYPEGLRLLAPWDQMFIYDVRVQEVNDTVVVLTSNGLPVTVTYSCRYRPDLKKLPYLHQTYGPNYVETLLKPEIVSSLREVLGNYRPEEIYSRSEQGLIDEIYQSLAAAVTNRYIVIQTIILKELRLTAELEAAINQKLVDEQNALAYEFRLKRERSEAQRKEIEAGGIRTFQQTSGISILKWRGIEATEELAKSPNTKIVVIGPGETQLPILLNTDK
jgi:regulator of protease activity HflC (stomatin/prohibitin superfamily)